MTEHCTICTENVDTIAQTLFCGHAMCVTCLYKCKECPFCRGVLYCNVDVVACIEMLVLSYPVEGLRSRLKWIESKLKRSRGSLQRVNSQYLSHWTLCRNYILGKEGHIEAAQKIVDNQIQYRRFCVVERFPLWMFIYDAGTDEYHTYTQPVKRKLVATITEQRNRVLHVQINEIMKTAAEDHTQFIIQYAQLEHKRANMAHDAVKKDGITYNSYLANLTEYSEELWILVRTFREHCTIQEQTMELMREYMGQQHAEESNLGFTIATAIIHAGNIPLAHAQSSSLRRDF